VAEDDVTVTPSSLVECVREYAELRGEILTPCKEMLAKCGVGGVNALAELIESERHSDSELFACFAVELLAAYKHPAVVPVLLRVLAEPGTGCPEEVLESLFNYAGGNTALLDPAFLAASCELRRTWKAAAWRGELIDQFVAWADRTAIADNQTGQE